MTATKRHTSRFEAEDGDDLRKLPLSMVAKATLIAVEIVRKNPGQVGFAVNPRRWVVERFFAWIGRNRRLAKDYEATIGSARLPLRRIRHAARASDR
jgi:transposase